MPWNTPYQNWQSIRNYTEHWRWRDPKTKKMTTGYNPPQTATEKERVPYYVRYVTLKGDVEDGNVVTLKVFRRRHQRMVQFEKSNEIRIINDYLILEVNGVRFVTQ